MATGTRLEKSAADRHERHPHLLALLLANGVLLFSSLLTRNRLIFPVALMACVVLTLGYLFLWNRIVRK
ncbi:MAG: hypothetical protein JO041_02420 [Acidobacteria bacterium]|nr:hypothetical protein [Acidobacteriota bacterium]